MNYGRRFAAGGARSRFIITALLVIAVASIISIPVHADEYTRWFEPVELRHPGSSESVEVVLQVSPGAAPGPYEYVYWVTNNTSAEMNSFYLTLVGSSDIAVFDPFSYRVIDGMRVETPNGVEFYWGYDNYDWGNLISGQSQYPHISHYDIYDDITNSLLTSTRFRWNVLGDGLAPGDSIGFSFINMYGPELFASSIASATAVYNYNELVYGPGEEPDIPEWPALLMAAPGLGLAGLLRRRFMRS